MFKLLDKTQDKKVIGTAFRAYLNMNYQTLVEKLGEPLEPSSDNKILCSWWIECDDNTIITIYNYKDGYNYDPNGKNCEEITDWHVGGFDDPENILEKLDEIL